MRIIPTLVTSLALIGPFLCSQEPPAVVSAVPAQQDCNASPASPVFISFDQPLDPATVTLQSVRVFGRWSGVVPGTVELDSSGQVLIFRPLRPYFPSEHVRVEISRAVTGLNGSPLASGFWTSFWVRPATGSGVFNSSRIIDLREEGESRIETYGVHAGDIDSDGCPDIIATNEDSNDIRVLKGGGCTPFSSMEIISDPGQGPSPAEGADFNGDGLLDLVTGNGSSQAISVYLGDGNSFGSPTNYATGGYTHGVAVLDVDGDGDTDVAAPNGGEILVFRNDGTGTLTLSGTYQAGLHEFGVSAADANGDGVVDLMTSARTSQEVAVLLGDGEGGFQLNAIVDCGGSPFQSNVGDVNGDGAVDIVTANRTTNTLGVILGDGQGGLLPVVTYPAGNDPTAVDLGDLDGDGDLDCVVSNVSSADYSLYWNNGSGVFGNLSTIEAPDASSCSTLVDFDRDGDTDLILADEVADELQLCIQEEPDPAGVQPAMCTATLRVNNLGNRAGFGGALPTPLQLGERAFFGVSGESLAVYLLAMGIGAEPGTPFFPAGLINLDLQGPLTLFFDGFQGSPKGMTDARGESLNWFVIPTFIPAGAEITFQGAIADSTATYGLRTTNPETVVFVW